MRDALYRLEEGVWRAVTGSVCWVNGKYLQYMSSKQSSKELSGLKHCSVLTQHQLRHICSLTLSPPLRTDHHLVLLSSMVLTNVLLCLVGGGPGFWRWATLLVDIPSLCLNHPTCCTGLLHHVAREGWTGEAAGKAAMTLAIAVRLVTGLLMALSGTVKAVGSRRRNRRKSHTEEKRSGDTKLPPLEIQASLDGLSIESPDRNCKLSLPLSLPPLSLPPLSLPPLSLSSPSSLSPSTSLHPPSLPCVCV